MEEVLTRQEAASYLRIPLGTLDYLTASMQIPYCRIGKRNIRFRKSRLDEYLSAHENVEFRLGPRKKNKGKKAKEKAK